MRKIKNINESFPKHGMNIAFLGLGGNIGDRRANLNKALKAIEKQCGTLLKTSKHYQTQAWGISSDKKYLNQVIKLETPLGAQELLKALLGIEKKLGRIRTDDQNSDRTIDLDILFYNSEIIDETAIQVPHPRMHLRKFVLVPLVEIEKDLLHPQFKKTMKQLLTLTKDKLEVTVLEEKKQLRYICIEGNLASGTSTLAKALAKRLKTSYLAEEFEQNHLLPLFYKDPAFYAFPLEYSFLISRFEQLSKHFEHHTALVISDFSVFKSLWFAKVNLKSKEYTLFEKHFMALASQIPKPDLFVYLRTNKTNLNINIKKRGRPYEQKISKGYLDSIEKQYERGYKAFELNIKKYHKGLEKELMKHIENYVKENFGQAI